jgi:predicted dehydrogenase
LTVLRVACLGAGYFSQFHLGSWQRIARVDLVAICDLDLTKARVARVPAFTDLTTMLEQTKPDLLDVILPPAGHAAAIRTAVAGGIKKIICQKPFCTSLEEAQQMVALADAAGCTLIIHENFRFQPWYRFIKARLDEGRIGQIIQATFRLRPGDGQGQDAYLDRQPYFRDMPRLLIHETGVHYVDVFRYLLGNPTHVYADLRKVNPVIAGEDAGIVVFEHASGARSILDGNRCLDHGADNTRRTMGEGLFEGTKGTLTLTGDGAVTLRAFGDVNGQVILPPDTHAGFGGDCTHALQSHVVAGVLDGATLENLAADYLHVITAEKAIYAAASDARKVAI